MRRLLVADHDPHIGQAIRIWLKQHGVRMSAADGGPMGAVSLGAIVDASTDVQTDIQHQVKPSQSVTFCRRSSNLRAFGDDAMGSGGAASVNQGRLPGVAGRRYTPQLE
jgi:hypothetical protein